MQEYHTRQVHSYLIMTFLSQNKVWTSGFVVSILLTSSHDRKVANEFRFWNHWTLTKSRFFCKFLYFVASLRFQSQVVRLRPSKRCLALDPCNALPNFWSSWEFPRWGLKQRPMSQVTKETQKEMKRTRKRQRSRDGSISPPSILKISTQVFLMDNHG